tara:strand:+ start:422 stop:5413 length:4992 start_codon:yes stop_codon:yes gene_type:complete
VASQSKRSARDSNADGLVDDSKKIKLATGQGPLNLRNWRGERLLASTNRWDVEKAVVDGSGFKVLLKGRGSLRGQFKVLEVNATGVVNGESKWQPSRHALSNGWESVFGDVIKNDGAIGRNSGPDTNGDGLFDRGRGRAYRILAGSDEMVTLRSKNGDPLSRNSSKRWEAVQALSVDGGFQVLLQKGSRRKPEFKLLNVGADGITKEKSAWLPQAEALFAGWDTRLKSSILATASSGGTVDAASVDGNGSVGQLIYTASASDTSGVIFSLQSLDDGSLNGLSIDANSGEVRLNPDAVLPLPDSIGFSVVAIDLAGNSTSLDVVVSLSMTVVKSGETSAESDAGLSALSVEDSLSVLSEESDALEDSTVKAEEQDEGSDVSLSDDSEIGSDVSDESPGVDSVNPDEDDDIPTLTVSVDSESDGVTNDNTPEFSGLASAEATVEVLAGEVLLGSAVADEEGAWVLPVADDASLADGEYLFTALELKPEGEDPSSSEASPLTIDRTAPIFTSSSDADATIELTSVQVDADLDGLVDGSNGTKIIDQDKIIQIFNKKGQIFEGVTDQDVWGFDVIRAVPHPDPDQEETYRLLLQGTGSGNRDLFGEWTTDSNGSVIANSKSWISEKQALKLGWEEVYGDAIKVDGEISKADLEDFSNTSGTFFVAKNGDNSNSGTIEAPFGSIQYAIGRLNPGDVLNIREGVYKEHLRINHLDGKADQRITIQSYGDEEVVVSGAKEISSEWFPHQGNIWKTKVDFDVTQLFLGDTMLTGARWPNISKDWHELDDSDGSNPTPGSYWDLKTRANTNSNRSDHKVSDLGFSVEGAVAVDYKNNAVDVTQHNPGESSFEVDGRLSGHYYLTQNLDLLDQPKEWHYEEETGELYVWLDGDANPNSQVIEARGYAEGDTSKSVWTNTPTKSVGSEGDVSSWGTPDKILQMQRSSFIDFNDITFRVGAFDLWGDHDITFEGTKFLYSAHPRLMLNAEKRSIPWRADRNSFTNSAGGSGRVKGVDVNNDAGTVNQENPHDANLKWINNEFAYNFASPDLDLGANAANYLIENSHFHNNPANGGFASFRVWDGMVARRNTVHSIGFGGMSRLGTKKAQSGGKSLGELNRIYDFHFSGDDSGIQINTGHAIGTSLQHNWIHDMPGRNGIRFDGDPAGIGGTAHHNVSFNNRRGYRFKGDQHTLVSNIAFDNEKYDFGIDNDKFYGYLPGYDPATQGLLRPENGTNVYNYRNTGRRGSNPSQGNLYSIVHNSAGNVERHPIPVLNPENKTGNSMTRADRGHSIKDELRDAANFDFRPRFGSSLIDAGTHQIGYTDGFIGTAPDIGPYEYGDDYYWIPGHKTEEAKSPIPMDGAASAKQNTDLIWLEGLEMTTNKVYFGSDSDSLEVQATQVSNIFTPRQSLVPGETYYWRVDTVTDDREIPGDVWSFTVGAATGPTDLALSTTELSSDAGQDDVLATLSTTDPDPVDSHKYSLVEGAGDIGNGFFSIKNGQLFISGSEELSADQSFQIRISSTDLSGNTFEKQFVLSTEQSPLNPIIEPITEPTTNPVTQPVTEPVTEPVIDTVKIIGDGSFGKKNTDLITNFDPASQRLEIDALSFGSEPDALFAVSKVKRVKKAAKVDADFVYHQRSGKLFFNPNGSIKRWGAGGLFAVLEGKPVLMSDIVDVS